MEWHLPSVFEARVVADVAATESVDATELAAGVVAVQEVVGGFHDLSIDDIVYEWRTQHHDDPFVEQTPAAYYLAVHEHVWGDVLDRAALSAAVRGAVRAVHRAQFNENTELEAPDVAMVLDRS